ncbi:hypothetical protein PV327_000921 [Microctonus hyperodae]|uniref:Uncharacterized protein n=1 Tax=Microctonus hyperodae TaxID=165561 RepID=A0AA39G783_MICHY|nr:hypothetical protein PV327_000921 [Microctonus hyperodae]
MTRILMNCVLIFIIVPHELITVWSENNILEKTWSRKKITKALKDMNLIELTEFQYPILIAPNEIASNNGTLNCETFKTIQNKRPKTYNGVADMQCYGWIDSCQSIRDDITRKHPAIYCFSERYKRLTWVRDGNSTQYGYETRKCKKTKLQSDNATKSKKDINNTCLCKCTRKSDNPESNTTNWAFSLQPQISNIENNKVVTGVRIANHSKMIYLEIKERRIGSYEDDNWKPPVSLKDLKRDVDYIFLRPDSRSINLDVIFLPDNYVVTGVKFSKIRVAYAEKRGWALRLKVQGTQIDWATKKLLTNTSTWFDSDTFAESSTDHKQKRYGISMQRLDPSSPMHDHDKVYESNTYVEFTTTELIRDLGRFTIPYMNTSPIQARTNKQLLDGVGLVYKGNKNYVDYIIPVVRSTLNSDFENNATVAIMAKRNQTDVFMNEDVEDITILNENQIKSVVTNDKKIPGSRLENITIKTTTEETIEKKYTIDERRSQLTTGKKNQANESLTDARNQLEKPMSAKETVKISTIEAVVAGRSVTEEQNTVSILTTESKEQEFLTIGSSKNSIEYEYSGINATQKIMPVVNAIGEKIKESDRLEKMTGKEILLEKSVIEANTTEVTIGKGSTTHTGFINIKRLEKINKNKSISQANTPEVIITEKESNAGKQTTELVVLEGNIRQEFHENGSIEDNLLDAHSEKSTTEDIMTADNTIELTTENHRATIATQLESSTTEKILSEISVKEKNKMEVNTEKQNMMLADAIMESSMIPASEDSNMTEEQTILPTTTDKSMQEKIYKSESSDTNLTDAYIEKSLTEESTTIRNAIESTTENQGVIIGSYLESTTTNENSGGIGVEEKIEMQTTTEKLNMMLENQSVIIGPYLGSTTTNENSGEIGVEEKIEMQTTTEKLNMMLGEAIVETSTTETTTERSNMIKGEIMISTTTDRTIQEEIYKIESSNINMTNDYSEKSTTEESMTTGNVIESTTENHSSTIGAYLESTTTEEFLSEIGVKERYKMEVTTEKQNMMLAGATVKSSTTEASTIESSMTDGGIMISTSTDRTIQEETYKIESSDMNITNVYSEKSTTVDIMTAENSIEASTENQRVTIIEESTNNNIMEVTGVKKALIDEYEIDRNISESTPREETLTNKIMSNENTSTLKKPDEEEISTKVVIEETTVMVPEIITANTLETITEAENLTNVRPAKNNTTEAITDERNVAERQYTILTTTKQSMRNELYTSESSAIHMLDAYSERNVTAEITLPGDTTETITENYNITTTSQTKSITVTKIQSEESVKERNDIETITETAKTSTMKIKTEVEHMKEAENIEANMVGKVRIDEARKDILKERTSVPTIENRFMIETIEKEGIISKIKTKNTDIEIPHLKFHVERAKNMSEISTKNINRTEVTTVKENDFEETAADVSTGNKTMGKEFITEKKLTENRINEAIAIEENTMEKSLKNEPHSSGSLEISELQTYLEKSTTEKALERENTIKTQTSNNSTTDKTTAETTMQNDELVKYKNMLESNAAKKSITKKTTIMKNEKGLEQSTLGRCRTRKRWQDNSGNTLHVHIISHVIILISIILVL